MTRAARRARGKAVFVRPAPTGEAALTRLIQGDVVGAEALACDVLARTPDDVTALQVRGVVAYQRADHEAACGFFQRVVALDPENSDGHYNLAEALKRLLRYESALPVYRRALELSPNNASTWINYAYVLVDRGQYGEAIDAARRALELEPDAIPALQNLSIAQWASGHVAEGIATIRRAVELDPCNASVWSNLLMYLQYSAAHGEDELLAAARAWGATMDRPRVGPLAAEMPAPERLRVGYVSGDFCDHPVAYQIEKVLEGHDRARVEVFLYSTATVVDAQTRRLRSLADGWAVLADLDDEAAARRIAEDGVHVLIDLSGHTARHRLPIFAYRPAPVQASWLGYFASTGLPQMDYVLRDRAQIPESEEGFYTERVWALEDAAFGYRPLPGCPELSSLPALARGTLTFASFNNPAKIGEESIRAWARVLDAVPGSRMILDRKGLDESVGRDRVLASFARCGIGPERLELAASRGHLNYMARYAEVDVVLDTFPCNGATTTYEAIWMGVPVVGHRWSRMVGHFAESILGLCGHGDWVADDEDGYVATAVALANDLPGLVRLRASLRGEMAASRLCEADDCARSLENAYEGMWRASREEAVGTAFERVVSLARRGQVAEAFAAFERAAALDPDRVAMDGPSIFKELGAALTGLGRYDEASLCFAESIRLGRAPMAT